MGQKRRAGSWLGGYIRHDAKGRKVYVIRRMVAGVRYEVSTRCTTERAALAELERFEADPGGYRPGGESLDAIYLDAKLASRYLAWCKERETSTDWLRKKRSFLAWWAQALKGVDLRRARLDRDIMPALDKARNRRQRIAVLKHVYSWLRTEEHRITTQEDPTFGRLKAPQAKAAQVELSKVVPLATIDAIRPHLSDTYRDALDLLCGTGWHVTELHRFAKGGACVEAVGLREGAVAILQVPLHKSGAPHRTAVSAPVKEVAARVLARGGLSPSNFHRAIHLACDAAGVPRFGPGQLRHSVATWAVEQGADLPSVSTFLGHKSMATTKRFYATHATPAKVPTIR